MKLVALLSILFPLISSKLLSYQTDGNGDIETIFFSWNNPDQSDEVLEGPNDATVVTDGDKTTGETLADPSGMEVWGRSPTDPQGLSGEFLAEKLNVDVGMENWVISAMEISFTADNEECWGVDAAASAWYIDSDTGAMVTIGAADVESLNGIITFSAPIDAAGVPTNGEIGFDVSGNGYCAESQILVTEFALEGEQVAEEVHECTGMVTWGDPHYHLMSMVYGGGGFRFDYQGLGWFYYVFPCNIERDYEDWPFYILSHQENCWWVGNPWSCIDNNRLILNTKPDPWVIDFYGTYTDSRRVLDITVGSDPVYGRSSDYYSSDNKISKRKYSATNPLIIAYNDDQGATAQSGEVHIWWEGNTVKLSLHDIAYNAYPRTCNRGTTFGSDCGSYTCGGEVLLFTSNDYWSLYTCPTCLKNIACGIMGHYIRGDCSWTEVQDKSSPCYSVLLGSDGEVYAPANNGAGGTFEQFAISWEKSVVDAVVASNGGAVTYEKEHKHVHGAMDGRAIDTSDSYSYGGYCFNNTEKIQEMNETCRENIVVQYAECCAEIGFCDELWGACVMDLCGCTMANDEGVQVMSEEWCLNDIVHSKMNTTCTWEAFYPEVEVEKEEAPITGVQKVMKFIWIYAVFVALFVIIAVVAYAYYKKKNNVKIIVPDDDEEEEAMDAKGTVDTCIEA